jgi:tRNA threonylcarbamoyladenosine biosynthesis protein TsaB
VTARWILGFDTSTPRCVIALGRLDDDGHHALVHADERDEDEGGNQASVHLVPRLEAALANAGIQPSALEAVACGCGPGTFTGTRVAVATAKGLCVGLGRPLVPVSTLVAVALSAEVSGWVLPLLDARRGETYGGLVRCTWPESGGVPQVEVVGEARCAPPAELAQGALAHTGDEPMRVVGTGVSPHLEHLPEPLRASVQAISGPSARGLWAACTRAFLDGAAIDPSSAAAVYLRKSYAELGVNKPKRPFLRSPFV